MSEHEIALEAMLCLSCGTCLITSISDEIGQRYPGNATLGAIRNLLSDKRVEAVGTCSDGSFEPSSTHRQPRLDMVRTPVLLDSLAL